VDRAIVAGPQDGPRVPVQGPRRHAEGNRGLPPEGDREEPRVPAVRLRRLDPCRPPLVRTSRQAPGERLRSARALDERAHRHHRSVGCRLRIRDLGMAPRIRQRHRAPVATRASTTRPRGHEQDRHGPGGETAMA
jgi:hypothetical protein